MTTIRPPRRLAAIASTALMAGALTLAVAPSVHAAPVFVDVDTTMATDSIIAKIGGCVLTDVITPDVTGPVAENGASTTQSSSGTSTGTNAGNPDVSISTSGTGTATLKSAGGVPTTIDLTASGSASIDVLGATSACAYLAASEQDFKFHFTVSQPGFLHLNMKGSKSSYSYVKLSQVDPTVDPVYEHYGKGTKFNSADNVYLPVGEWFGEFYGETFVESTSDRSATSTTEIHATFNVAGSQTEAVSGKGKKYVSLPGARTCAAHTLDSAVTGKKKRADTIKQVTYFVNDQKVKKVKTPDKGDSAKLSVADEAAAEVVAEVTLFPAKKGHPGKVFEVSASYEACA